MKKRDTEEALVAENCVLRAEVSKCRAKVEAMADECHAVKRRLLDETKQRQVGCGCLIAFVSCNCYVHIHIIWSLSGSVAENAGKNQVCAEGGQFCNYAH